RHLEFFFMFPTGMCFQHTSGFFAQFRKTFPEWGEENRAYILKFLDYLNRHLADRRYIMGDQFSIADISAFCTLDFNKVNNIRVQPEQQPHLQRWYDDIRSRPSAQAGGVPHERPRYRRAAQWPQNLHRPDTSATAVRGERPQSSRA